MPLPNAFRRDGEPMPGHYPVELLVCPRCHLGQLSAIVDPNVMYTNYPYVTSPSDTMKEHFKRLWDTLNAERKINAVVEIGSNDGLLLEHFRNFGAQQVLGIDPAENLVDVCCIKRGIPAICSLFNREAAEETLDTMPAPIDLILARHVFCHIDNWRQFIDDVTVICSKNTVVCLEVPYAHDTVENCEWDTVYAEHLNYLTLQAMEHLLSDSALHLHHVVRFPIHGGAIALLLRRNDAVEPPSASVDEFLASERCSLEDWQRFGQKANEQIGALKALVKKLRSEGKRVVGYGASAKSTVWINAMGLRRSDIECVYDGTPQKQYCTIPGTDIPVRHEGAFYADAADYAVVWAWNFLSEVITKNKKWTEGGGKFIVPVPEVRILE